MLARLEDHLTLFGIAGSEIWEEIRKEGTDLVEQVVLKGGEEQREIGHRLLSEVGD